MKQALAIGRLVALAGLMTAMAVVTPIQAYFIRPILKNKTAVPGLFYRSLALIFGIDVRMSPQSAPITDKQNVAVANHMSIGDFVALGVKLDTIFAGKGDVLEMPGIAQMARSANYIGLKRASKKDSPEVYEKNLLKGRSKVISELEDGNNVTYFPEGTTTDGKNVALFRSGLMKIFYDAAALGRNGESVKLTRDVVVQPIAIRVFSVDGKNAVGNDDLRNVYSQPKAKGLLDFAWNFAMSRRTVLELTVFEPLDPKNFANAEDLANEAARKIASVVNPEQVGFQKARIPGMDDSKKDQVAPTPK
jgi:1-acyl-sn-glycerol-3-phosphate acyltransferase